MDVNVLTRLANKRLLAVCALTGTILLSGCNLGGDGKEEMPEKSTLRVMYYDENGFYSQYGMLFSALHPETEIEVVSTRSVKPGPDSDYNAEMLKFIEEQKPDIIMLSSDQYRKLAGEGKLLDLSPMIEDKAFNKETVIPGLIDYFRDLGGGKVYGLTPSYYSQVLYYNKDLFNKYKIELPQDRMTWDKLFELAKRFPTDGSPEKRIYGLSAGYQSDLYQLGSMIGSSLNLTMVNPNTMQMTMDTDAWANTFEIAKSALKSGTLYTDQNQRMPPSGSYEDYLLQDPFVAGKVAMKIDTNNLMDQIKEAQGAVKDKAIKNWDMVTMPVNPQNPDSSPNVMMYQIFGIHAKSPNEAAAKAFLTYITSEEFARVTSKQRNGGMSIRTTYFKDEEGHNLKAFYTIKPAESAMYKGYEKLPQDFFMQFMGFAQSELKSVMDDKQSIKDALATIQKKGQEILQAAKAKNADESKKPDDSKSGASAEPSTATASSAASPAKE